MGAVIKGISYYLPEKVLTNDQLAQLYPGWTASKIFRKTGIKSRHIADEGELVSDMAEKAAKRLFEEYGVNPAEIDFLLLATQTPDYILPTTACLLQERLGLRTSCGALDFNLGCSAYIYGLALAKSLVSSGTSDNVLLITSEAYTKHIHPMDKSVRTIFGDGATATLIKKGSDRIGQFVFGTDGRGYKNLIIPAGGAKLPRSAETGLEAEDDSGNIRSKDNLYMNGPEVFSFTLEAVPATVTRLLDKNGLAYGDIDLFVFHQANRYMLDYLREQLNIGQDKFYINMENTGNTVSSSIPLALRMAQDEGRLRPGFRVMLVGFGVGYSWGGTVIEWE